MRCPSLAELPPPPLGKTGWPWTVETPRLAPIRPDGSPWPRISVVTPSYNQGKFIEETIRSVLLQGYPDLEYFIMDGLSEDRSVEIIRRYEPWVTQWRSNSDGGQAAAINVALRCASGTWFQNINSDDVLALGALARVGATPLETDIAYGEVFEFSEKHTHLVYNSRPSVRALLQQLFRTEQVGWHQPGVFLKRKEMLALGGYDQSLSYLFDFHLTARYFERYPRSHRINAILVHFRIHEDAKSSAWPEVHRTESIRARELLATQLTRNENRRLANYEAIRRQLFFEISSASLERSPSRHAKRVLRILARRPTLLFERMFLGSLRRRPTFWFAAIAGR